jgi:small-conductance mechanosensitive channel
MQIGKQLRGYRRWCIALLLGVLCTSWGLPSLAQLAPLASGGDTQTAHERRLWSDVNRARRCGRMWCSDVVFPQDIRHRGQIVLAINPEAGMAAAAAAQAAETRAETVQVSLQGVTEQLRQSTKEQADQPTEGSAVVVDPRQRDWAFWWFGNRKPVHPDTPSVVVGIKNKSTVVFVAANQERNISQRTLLTVTEPDSIQAGKSVKDLAEQWRTLLETAISEGLWGQDFNRLHPMARWWLTCALAVGLALVLILISQGRKFLRRAMRKLRRRGEALQASAAQDAMQAMGADQGATAPGDDGEDQPQADGAPAAPVTPFLRQLGRSASEQPLKLMRRTSKLLEPLSIKGLRRQGLQDQLENLLEIILVISNLLRLSLLVVGVGVIVAFFPDSRVLALGLAKQAVVIPLIWLVLMLARFVAVVSIDHSLTNWTIEATLNDPDSRRYALRASTYSRVLKQYAGVLSVALGIVCTLVVLGVDQNVLTGAGVIAIGLGLLLRNLLQDMLQGAQVLLTDRYAIGDVVSIPPYDGFVENMSLFQTQLRGVDGQLTTLPNGMIGAVQNLTRDWSRVNFEIEVAATEDLRAVLALVEDVAEGMRNDPAWRDDFLATAEVLGVDKVQQSGCLIRVWIKTVPLAQWRLGREYRLRIKEAFDRAGIRLGLPRQELLVDQLTERG